MPQPSPELSLAACPQCGSVPPPGSPAGHCALCLARAAFAFSESEEPAEPALEASQPWSVLGDCELLEEIGRGGMGVVYRARQRRLGREVAVKVLRGGQFAGAEARQRFQAEAEHAAALRHPGIVTVHDFGEEQGVCWISMEFIAGRNLDDVTRHQPMPAREAAECVRQVAAALAHAHGQGVLHRDLKPSNILLDAGGAPHIADFGIARRLDGGTAFTRTGQMLGSPGFTAPEQALRGEADARTDVYGLGAILYSVLTSRPPFQGPTAESVLVQLREDDPLPPRRLNPAVPRGLENIVLKCLARDPAGRYATAEALAADLTAWLEGRPVTARPVSLMEKAWRCWRRRPALAAALTVAVLALLGGTVVSLALAGKAREAAAAARVNEARALAAADETRRALYAATVLRAQEDLRQGNALAAPALAKLIPAAGEKDLRGWEWYWLDRQLHQGRLLRDDQRPGDPRAIAWTRDGKRLAVSTMAESRGRARIVQVLHPETLAVEQTLSGFDREVPYLDWHPDGERLLVCDGGGGVSVWNALRGERLYKLDNDPVDLRSYHPPRACWSPDGSQFAIYSYRTGLTLHRPEDGAELRNLAGPAASENALAWHPAGDRIAIAGTPKKEAQVISTGGEILARLPQEEAITAVAWSPDGAQLAIGTAGAALSICDPSAPQQSVVSEVATGVAGHLLWTEDGGRVIAGGWSGVPFAMNAATGAVEHFFHGHAGGWITSMARHGDRLRTWCKDATLREFSLTENGEGLMVPGAVTHLALQDGIRADIHQAYPMGRTAVWETGGTVHSEFFRWGRALAWHPDGNRFALVRNLDPARYGLGGIVKPGSLIEFRSTGAPALPELRLPLRLGYRIEELHWSPQGDRLLVTSAGSKPPFCAVLDATDGREICRIAAAPGYNAISAELPNALAWSPDGRLIAMGAGDVLYDAATGQPAVQAVTHSMRRFAKEVGGPFISLAWSPDQTRLAFGFPDSGQVLLMDARSGEWLGLAPVHNGWVRALAFSPDGTRLATAGRDRTVKLLDAWNLAPLLLFKDHQADVRAVAWSADGKAVVSADVSGCVVFRSR